MSTVQNGTTPQVSIIIPHFQTAELVKLCLRSIRKFTPRIAYEVLVIDNNSQDGASLEYLRSVPWIRLIERTVGVTPGGQGHREAVELGIHAARAPFVLTAHTDTIPIREDWLEYHLDPMLAEANLAAIGTDRLKLRSRFTKWFRALETWVMFWKQNRHVRKNNRFPYVRSHCALYRKELLIQHQIRYDRPEPYTAGMDVYNDLISLGYECRMLDPAEVIERVVHLEHATSVLVPSIRQELRRLRTFHTMSRLRRFLTQPSIRQLLQDSRWDQATLPTAEIRSRKVA